MSLPITQSYSTTLKLAKSTRCARPCMKRELQALVSVLWAKQELNPLVWTHPRQLVLSSFNRRRCLSSKEMVLLSIGSQAITEQLRIANRWQCSKRNAPNGACLDKHINPRGAISILRTWNHTVPMVATLLRRCTQRMQERLISMSLSK